MHRRPPSSPLFPYPPLFRPPPFAVRVFFEVGVGGVPLPPPAPAVAERLVLGQFLARGQFGRGVRGPVIEAGRAHGGEARGDLEELAPADADGPQALREQVDLRIRDPWGLHGSGLLHFSLGSSASRTPSPKNVNDSMVTAMAIDGNTQRCQ